MATGWVPADVGLWGHVYGDRADWAGTVAVRPFRLFMAPTLKTDRQKTPGKIISGNSSLFKYEATGTHYGLILFMHINVPLIGMYLPKYGE